MKLPGFRVLVAVPAWLLEPAMTLSTLVFCRLTLTPLPLTQRELCMCPRNLPWPPVNCGTLLAWWCAESATCAKHSHISHAILHPLQLDNLLHTPGASGIC